MQQIYGIFEDNGALDANCCPVCRNPLDGNCTERNVNGKPNKAMILIVSLTTFVMLTATVPVIYIVVAGIAAADAGRSMSAIEAFKICMGDAKFSRLFYCDLTLVVLFTVLRAVMQIFVPAKSIKHQKNI